MESIAVQEIATRMDTFHAFHSAWEPAPRESPAGVTLLAVGDVHGCAAHLDAMLVVLGAVVDDARRRSRRCELIMLGDYVDRGPNSSGVLARLPGLGARLGGGGAGGEVPVHLLRGNHDQFLIDHLRVMPHPGALEMWLENGGESTLAQLGMEVIPNEAGEDGPGLSELSARLRERLGPDLVTLLRGLPAYRLIGPYLFVHAGVRPDLPLAEHSLEDLLWVREPFLHARDWPHPFAAVHGHTPLGPEVLPHRVGVDSGCFFTGVLTAVEIEGDRLRFHAVSGDPDPRALRELAAVSGQPRMFIGQRVPLRRAAARERVGAALPPAP